MADFDALVHTPCADRLSKLFAHYFGFPDDFDPDFQRIIHFFSPFLYQGPNARSENNY